MSRLSTLAYTWRRYEDQKRVVAAVLESAEADVERPLVPASQNAVQNEIEAKTKLIRELEDLEETMAAVTSLNSSLKVGGEQNCLSIHSILYRLIFIFLIDETLQIVIVESI